MSITVCNFTNVYENQPFMEGLRHSGEAIWIDCTDIPGTDCYCDDEAVEAICRRIADAGITDAQGIHFIDNGNYHYMSKLWTDRIAEPFTLVVFDHHPDMQEPRFGDILSCGGWVKKVLNENKFIDNVVLIGVADHLVDEICEELSQADDAEILDKVTFIRESEIDTLSSLVCSELASVLSSKLYISIDKDALSPAYAATNWDQGSLDVALLKNIITNLAANHKILGIDICGERARDFSGDEHHTVQEADALNNELNRDLLDFVTQQVDKLSINP